MKEAAFAIDSVELSETPVAIAADDYSSTIQRGRESRRLREDVAGNLS